MEADGEVLILSTMRGGSENGDMFVLQGGDPSWRGEMPTLYGRFTWSSRRK